MDELDWLLELVIVYCNRKRSLSMWNDSMNIPRRWRHNRCCPLFRDQWVISLLGQTPSFVMDLGFLTRQLASKSRYMSEPQGCSTLGQSDARVVHLIHVCELRTPPTHRATNSPEAALSSIAKVTHAGRNWNNGHCPRARGQSCRRMTFAITKDFNLISIITTPE
jgi:hypothetical protein